MSKKVKFDTKLHVEKRDRYVAFKLTPSEYSELDARCKDVGVSISRYIRYLITNDIKSSS